VRSYSLDPEKTRKGGQGFNSSLGAVWFNGLKK
jgi:hypothetical protein